MPHQSPSPHRLVQPEHELPQLRRLLCGLLSTGVARDVLWKLADGHGTHTEDGRVWLEAADFVSRADPENKPALLAAQALRTSGSGS
jgi:hypothetical protein